MVHQKGISRTVCLYAANGSVFFIKKIKQLKGRLKKLSPLFLH